jgi:hypothetical protein
MKFDSADFAQILAFNAVFFVFKRKRPNIFPFPYAIFSRFEIFEIFFLKYLKYFRSQKCEISESGLVSLLYKKKKRKFLPAVAPGTCLPTPSTRRGPEEPIEVFIHAAVHILNSQSPSIFTIQSP